MGQEQLKTYLSTARRWAKFRSSAHLTLGRPRPENQCRSSRYIHLDGPSLKGGVDAWPVLLLTGPATGQDPRPQSFLKRKGVTSLTFVGGWVNRPKTPHTAKSLHTFVGLEDRAWPYRSSTHLPWARLAPKSLVEARPGSLLAGPATRGSIEVRPVYPVTCLAPKFHLDTGPLFPAAGPAHSKIGHREDGPSFDATASVPGLSG